MSKKIKWSEIFMSLEGEGPYTGWPTAYLRFTNCCFSCKGFNNPDHIEITNDVLGYDPADYNNIRDLPPVEIGCDTIYAIDKRFRHMWNVNTVEEVTNILLDTIPGNSWISKKSKQPILFSITGGEPTLQQQAIIDLLNHPNMSDANKVIIETNGAVPLKPDFIQELNNWTTINNKTIVWSVSPKLSASGEKWEKAIRPDIVSDQLKVHNCEHYFKFVCSNDIEQFNEVTKAVSEYVTYDDNLANSPIYIMPMACTGEQQNKVAQEVADLCIDYGYVLSYRLQNAIFENAIGK